MSQKRMVTAGKIVELAGRRFIVLRSDDIYERLKSGKLVRADREEYYLLREQAAAERAEAQRMVRGG